MIHPHQISSSASAVFFNMHSNVTCVIIWHAMYIVYVMHYCWLNFKDLVILRHWNWKKKLLSDPLCTKKTLPDIASVPWPLPHYTNNFLFLYNDYESGQLTESKNNWFYGRWAYQTWRFIRRLASWTAQNFVIFFLYQQVFLVLWSSQFSNGLTALSFSSTECLNRTFIPMCFILVLH